MARAPDRRLVPAIPWLLAVGLACNASAPARAPTRAADGHAATATAGAARAPIRIIDLPPPRLDGSMSLERTLAARVSVRTFTDEALTLAELSQLLWAAQGITHGKDRRTAPSAGAKFPLEIYVVTRTQLLHYVPQGHKLEVLREADLVPAVAKATFQDFVADAPTIIVITAVHARTRAKYRHRYARYVRQETGHASQNILLQAVALDLGAVTMGGFRDAVVTRALDLPGDHAPEYLILVGHPRAEAP